MLKKILSIITIFSFILLSADQVFADSLDPIVVNEITVAESSDFVELYAREDVNLIDYVLKYSKTTSDNYYTITLPDIELSRGDFFVVGEAEKSDLPEKINIVQNGDRLVWLEEIDNTAKIGQMKYPTTMKVNESYQRVCDEKFEKSSQPSPGKENISLTSCDANVNIEDPDDPIMPEDPDVLLEPQYCDKLELSEISTNEQWIEIYNNSNKTIQPNNLVDCKIGVQRGEKKDSAINYYYQNLADLLIGGSMAPYSFLVINIENTSLKLAKSVKNRSVIITDSETEFDETFYSTQKSGTSLAWFGKNDWRITNAVTKGEENIFQKWQTCEAGKHVNEKTGNCVKDKEAPAECADGYFRNPKTGRCKKVSSPKELTECAEGYYRNPLTNRCKKISSSADKALAECPAGQYRNPATNRCKKYSTKDDLTPCAEGWERNPETNRCRKIVQKEDAKYALEPNIKNSSDDSWRLAGLGSLVFVGSLTTWQFRPELMQFGRKILDFLRRGDG